MSFDGSTPNYALICNEAGLEGMTAQIAEGHVAMFATESTRDGLAEAFIERFERYGVVARSMSAMRDHRKVLPPRVRDSSAVAGRGPAPIAGTLRAVFDPPIVIKNTGFRYQETPFNST